MAIALLLLISISSSWAAPANLLPNPGFERGLSGWQSGLGGPAQLDEQTAHSGKASLRLAVDGQTAAADADGLIVGYDMDPSIPYRIAAWIKSGGVSDGGFGGRIYFYGPEREYVGMLSFGALQAGAEAGDWQQASIDLQPGTQTAIPEGTQEVMIRFSFWDQDQECTGTVWVDDVAVTPLAQAPAAPAPDWLVRSEKGTVLVLKDDFPVAGTMTSPDTLAAFLRGEGMAVNVVSADQFVQEGALNPRAVDFVVLPYEGVFPADARDAFVKYVKFGGSFLTLGGLPFERFMRRVDGAWIDVTTTVSDPAGASVVANFEEQQPEWETGHLSDADAVTIVADAPGADGSKSAAKVTCDVGAFVYGGLTDAAAPDENHEVLRFWAKGDANTDRLAVEVRESDESRWKKVVRLTEEWTEYEIQAKHFLSYASEGRGGPGDFLHPEKAAGLWFGFTVGMVGKGEHTIWLDGIEWRPLVTGAGAPPAPIRPAAEADLTAASFGSDLAIGDAIDSIPVFTPAQSFEGATELRLAEPGTHLGIVAEGAFSGSFATVPELPMMDGKNRDLRIGRRLAGRFVPLLTAHDADGNALGPAAGLYYPARATQQGAVWGLFGVRGIDITADVAHWEDVVRRIARAATGAPGIMSATMSFAAVEGVPIAQLNAELHGTAEGADLAVMVRSGGRVLYEERVAAADLPIDIPGLDPLALEYQFEVGLLGPGGLLDFETVKVDAKASFLELADWLLERQREDGTISGISFEDNRAMRGILGAYEMTDEEKYRAAAIRWGEEMIRLQREDGGYRMGYGIGSKGESCYVADGGEIAIAMARLTSYLDGEQREKFVKSLKAYFGYRESFRQDSGAIGVGWCMHDYGQRPIVPLDKPTRIYAGESNTYTIGCSLAAASAYALITDDPADMQMALRDTDWLLEHYKSYSGAAAESAFWAHRFIADEALKARIVADLESGFRQRVVQPADQSWLGGGGRSVLDLDGITWWLWAVDADDAEMQAAFGRWIYALCAPNSTSAVRRLLSENDLNGNEKRFVDFLAVALADAVQPMVSLRDF